MRPRIVGLRRSTVDGRKRLAATFGGPKNQRMTLVASTLGIFTVGLICWSQPPAMTVYLPLYSAHRAKQFYGQLGVSLCTAGVLSLSYELLLRKGTERYISSRLYDLISTMNSTSAQAESVGIGGILFRRDSRMFETLLEEAQKEFVCAGISLPDICNTTMLDRIVERLRACPSLQVRILLLSPFSISAVQKDSYGVYSGRPALYLPNQIMNSALSIRALSERLGVDAPRLGARFYWNPPTLSIVMNERRADVAAYDEVGAANLSPSIQVKRSEEGRSVLYSRYLDHFNLMWSSSRSVNVLEKELRSSLAEQVAIDQGTAVLAARFFQKHVERLEERD